MVQLNRYCLGLSSPTMRTKKVIRQILLFLTVLAAYAPLQAQIRLALYGGIHSANVIEKNSIPGWGANTGQFYSARTGFQVGFLAEIPIGTSGFYLQPAIVYNGKGRQYAKYNDSATAVLTDTIFTQNTLKLGYMELPLLLTYKFPISANHRNSIFLSAGPYFSFFFNGTMNVQDRIHSSNQYEDQNIDLNVGNATDKYKTFDMGITAKAGIELGQVMLSGYFSQGLSNFYTAAYAGSFHHQLLGITLGIWLTKPTPVPPKSPKDSDGDGIADKDDACPLQPGLPKYNGCPVPDTDHDGINDEEDSCKTIPGVARYHGCPIPDQDGDGIDDEHDSCPTLAGTLKYHGCPIPDRDGDGINDEEDQCPDQPGTAENKGCPLSVIQPAKKLAYEGQFVTFRSGSSRLTQPACESLNILINFLVKNPLASLTITGHTDNTGDSLNNLILSQQRANEVRRYLVSKGIASTRIKVDGVGDRMPLASNKTKQGKSTNRRVAFKLEENRH